MQVLKEKSHDFISVSATDTHIVLFHPFADSCSSPASLEALSFSVLPMAQEKVLSINTKLHLASDGEHWIFSSKLTFLSNANSPGSEGPTPVRSLLPSIFISLFLLPSLPCQFSEPTHQFLVAHFVSSKHTSAHPHLNTHTWGCWPRSLVESGSWGIQRMHTEAMCWMALPIGRIGIGPFNIELKDEASFPTIHSTVSLHLTPETPMWKENYYNF